MNLETFFQRFDQISSAPGAVAMMRELILKLAVRGQLVEQISSEGTADEIIEALSGNVNFATFDPEDSNPIDFPLRSIPGGWRWVPTAALCELQTGKRMKGGAQDSGVISLGGEHLRSDGTIDYSIPRYISLEFYNEMRVGHVELYDTLMVKDGATTGKTSFVSELPADERVAVNEHVFILRWHAPIEKQFAYYFIRAFAPTHIATKSAGLIGGIRREAILDFPFPVPPIAEQKRIVAKVNQLMDLCDRLQQQQDIRQTKHAALVRASLSQFIQSPTSENLDFIFHGSYAVSPTDLRKVILTLAVQGLLVRQQTDDGSAETLLRKIWSDNGILEKRNIAKPSAASADLPFEIPKTWSVAKLGTILTKNRGISYGVIKLGPEPKQGGTYVLRCSNVRFRRIDLSGIRRVTDELSLEYGRTILEGGELLINVRGTLGGCAVVPSTLRGFNIAREVAVIPVHSEIDPKFLLNVIAAPYFQNKVDESLRGIAYEGLNLSLLREFVVPVPPLAEQQRIASKVDQLMLLVDQLEIQIDVSFSTSRKLINAAAIELTTEG